MQPQRRGPAGLAGISIGGMLTALSGVLVGTPFVVLGAELVAAVEAGALALAWWHTDTFARGGGQTRWITREFLPILGAATTVAGVLTLFGALAG
ncbi:hypothetical protein [Natrinema marinum]|uniref:hypothetical protein n=1 Tax=Natrinema marinum TaxID=2961598 RepID=UPI0020C93548|nr:hypothetical protein [Natrinema marinum]